MPNCSGTSTCHLTYRKACLHQGGGHWAGAGNYTNKGAQQRMPSKPVLCQLSLANAGAWKVEGGLWSRNGGREGGMEGILG